MKVLQVAAVVVVRLPIVSCISPVLCRSHFLLFSKLKGRCQVNKTLRLNCSWPDECARFLAWNPSDPCEVADIYKTWARSRSGQWVSEPQTNRHSPHPAMPACQQQAELESEAGDKARHVNMLSLECRERGWRRATETLETLSPSFHSE